MRRAKRVRHRGAAGTKRREQDDQAPRLPRPVGDGGIRSRRPGRGDSRRVSGRRRPRHCSLCRERQSSPRVPGCMANETDIVFDDGGTHTLDTDLGSVAVEVYDGPGSSATTVNVVDGAYMRFLRTYGSSRVYVSGGRVTNELKLFESSEAYVSGGLIDEVISYGSSRLRISGCEGNDIEAGGASHVSVFGGDFPDLVSSGKGEVHVFDGTYENAMACRSPSLAFRVGVVSI